MEGFRECPVTHSRSGELQRCRDCRNVGCGCEHALGKKEPKDDGGLGAGWLLADLRSQRKFCGAVGKTLRNAEAREICLVEISIHRPGGAGPA